MTSQEGMALIQQALLQIDESLWLPQWSFDFWIIPYLAGRGISRDRLRQFMTAANGLLKLGMCGVSDRLRQRELLDLLIAALRGLPATRVAGECG
jgi:p-methyltransferase